MCTMVIFIGLLRLYYQSQIKQQVHACLKQRATTPCRVSMFAKVLNCSSSQRIKKAIRITLTADVKEQKTGLHSWRWIQGH